MFSSYMVMYYGYLTVYLQIIKFPDRIPCYYLDYADIEHVSYWSCFGSIFFLIVQISWTSLTLVIKTIIILSTSLKESRGEEMRGPKNWVLHVITKK